MLFRLAVALFALVNTLQLPSFAAAEGTAQGSEITVVGPTEQSAAFIAVRPAVTPMQPGVRPAQTGAVPQLNAVEPEVRPAQTETVPELDDVQPEVHPAQTGMVPQSEAEEPETESVAAIGHGGEPMMQRLANILGEPALATGDREMLRRVLARMRGRRLHRGQVQPSGRMGSPMRERPAAERPREPRPVAERPREEGPREERPTVGRPMRGRPAGERPREERPRAPATERPRQERPTTEQVPMDPFMTTPEFVELPDGRTIRGRFRASGDIEITPERWNV